MLARLVGKPWYLRLSDIADMTDDQIEWIYLAGGTDEEGNATYEAPVAHRSVATSDRDSARLTLDLLMAMGVKGEVALKMAGIERDG